MTASDTGGQLGEEFFTPGTASFTEFLAAHRPELLPTPPPLPDGGPARPGRFPHGPTVPAPAHRGGVLIAGGRRAPVGHPLAQRGPEEVHPADGCAAVAFGGSVGLALDMVKLY